MIMVQEVKLIHWMVVDQNNPMVMEVDQERSIINN